MVTLTVIFFCRLAERRRANQVSAVGHFAIFVVVVFLHGVIIFHGNSDSFCVREKKSQLGVCSLSFPSMPSCHYITLQTLLRSLPSKYFLDIIIFVCVSLLSLFVYFMPSCQITNIALITALIIFLRYYHFQF